MPLCGVEIKGSEAIFAVVEVVDGHWEHLPIETKRIALDDDDDAKNVRSFADLVAGFLRDNKLTEIAIKKRGKKGEFAGGPTHLKIERSDKRRVGKEGVSRCRSRWWQK